MGILWRKNPWTPSSHAVSPSHRCSWSYSGPPKANLGPGLRCEYFIWEAIPRSPGEEWGNWGREGRTRWHLPERGGYCCGQLRHSPAGVPWETTSLVSTSTSVGTSTESGCWWLTEMFTGQTPGCYCWSSPCCKLPHSCSQPEANRAPQSWGHLHRALGRQRCWVWACLSWHLQDSADAINLQTWDREIFLDNHKSP